MTDSCVQFRQVFKSYGEGEPVIKGISLDIPVELTTALVGESGSGKSTLLQIINGLVVPERGEVFLYDERLDYSDLPTLRRRMGYAVQGAGLFPHMTVRDNVTLVARLEGWTQERIAERYEYLLGLLELTADFSDRYPHSLSGGQQQRVSLCRAMMLNPPLMLLDEPFSALDPITRETIHQEFIRLQAAESRSIILVTHDMAEAVKLAQHLVILRDGEIVQQGNLDEVRARPDDEYVSQLFAGAGVA
ncbi:MAG: ATP-binding cassette domain-containing protein [Pseudomonadales bacterium]|nr:ATP-binding cassette domain-containing protein [Pseudomonadales bacterium]